MSRMIPRRSIDQLRNYVDISLISYGIECTLYIPTNTSYSEVEKQDVFFVPGDYDYLSYSAKVFINWTASTYKLKKLGLYTEDAIPIVGYMGTKATVLEGSNVGDEVDIDITLHSYIKIAPEFVPDSYVGNEEFEVVNIATPSMQEAAIVQIYSLVPRRIKH